VRYLNIDPHLLKGIEGPHGVFGPEEISDDALPLCQG
jgi:hypothetical protein